MLEIRELLEKQDSEARGQRELIEDDINEIRNAKTMKSAIDAILHGEADKDAFFKADLEFHETIARATKNLLFQRLLDAFREVLQIHQNWSTDEPGAYDDVVRHHNAIFNAIKSKNPKEAMRVMVAHIRKIGKFILNHPEQSTIESKSKADPLHLPVAVLSR